MDGSAALPSVCPAEVLRVETKQPRFLTSQTLGSSQGLELEFRGSVLCQLQILHSLGSQSPRLDAF